MPDRIATGSRDHRALSAEYHSFIKSLNGACAHRNFLIDARGIKHPIDCIESVYEDERGHVHFRCGHATLHRVFPAPLESYIAAVIKAIEMPESAVAMVDTTGNAVAIPYTEYLNTYNY
ncbi:MAG: hypothetical protein LBS17_03400 [Actinomycetes bacterium]|jgi:hypothetical protein|nr:hypothetical protein [Actinomycetes bacterium]